MADWIEQKMAKQGEATAPSTPMVGPVGPVMAHDLGQLCACKACTSWQKPADQDALLDEVERRHKAEYARATTPASPPVGGFKSLVRLDVVPGYEDLAGILDAALEQAQRGKGAERHGNGLPFADQPMFTIPEVLGFGRGDGFQIGQAMKKLSEADGPWERVRADRLGAIVYIAASILRGDAKIGEE